MLELNEGSSEKEGFVALVALLANILLVGLLADASTKSDDDTTGRSVLDEIIIVL